MGAFAIIPRRIGQLTQSLLDDQITGMGLNAYPNTIFYLVY